MSAGDREQPQPWLVIIDPQVIFSDPAVGPWGSPMWKDTVGRIRELAVRHQGRVVITRFVADPDPQGSWVPYYQEWAFAQLPDDHPLNAVVPELADLDAPVVTQSTSGKWGPELRAIVGDNPHLILSGVTTDCCVLATALPAADAGATVVIQADACAGSTPENHRRALDAMALFGPQIVVQGDEG